MVCSSLDIDFGITGGVLSWIQSCIMDRTQSVVISSSSSAPQLLTVGLPQGLLVGPGLFATNISPMLHIAHKHGRDICMHADDAQLYLSLTPC